MNINSQDYALANVSFCQQEVKPNQNLISKAKQLDAKNEPNKASDQVKASNADEVEKQNQDESKSCLEVSKKENNLQKQLEKGTKKSSKRDRNLSFNEPSESLPRSSKPNKKSTKKKNLKSKIDEQEVRLSPENTEEKQKGENIIALTFVFRWKSWWKSNWWASN